MSPGFISSLPALQVHSSTRSTFATGCVCNKSFTASIRVAKRSHRNIQPVRMMAKYQQKEESNSQQLDEETQLEKAMPPPALPTLTTLTGQPGNDIDLSRITTGPPDTTQRADESEGDGIATMGAGIPSKKENAAVQYLSEVAQEAKQIEWPSAGRVVRLTITILITIAVSAFALYLIDGFFYRMSQVLFEGKI